MNPIIAIKDNFFDSLEFLSHIQASDFVDYELGVDGVTYPYISTNIPKAIEYELLYKLERILGAKIQPHYLFMRAMPEGCHAPSKIHSDRDMGSFTAHVYLSPRAHESSTAFLAHRDLGQTCEPHHSGSEWTQNPEEWDTLITAHGKQNRLLVHHAKYFHAALPQNGYGILGLDARLMLTMFFDVL